MRYLFDWTLEREDGSIDVEVSGTYRPGTSDSYWEPGDPPEFEIESVKFNGMAIETSREEDDAIASWVCENPPEFDDWYED